MKETTIEDVRNQTDANAYVDRAIEMLKPEIVSGRINVAAYNGVLSLLRYAKESHAASLNRQGWTRVSKVDKARFWSKANDTGYCWEWQGSKNNDGYGHFKIHGGHITASRMAYQLINGDIPDGLQVLHKCDNPSCVNPSHLFVGTVQDNMNDMIMKGRNRALGKSSRYHGVRFRKDNGKWRSFYTINGVVTSLGCFENEVDAAKKRDAAVKELNLDLPLNFK